jgi:hypothetical protein
MKLLPDQTIKDWEEDEARAASGGMDGADASFLFFPPAHLSGSPRRIEASPSAGRSSEIRRQGENWTTWRTPESSIASRFVLKHVFDNYLALIRG